jgi:hypothetical protein
LLGSVLVAIAPVILRLQISLVLAAAARLLSLRPWITAIRADRRHGFQLGSVLGQHVRLLDAVRIKPHGDGTTVDVADNPAAVPHHTPVLVERALHR